MADDLNVTMTPGRVRLDPAPDPDSGELLILDRARYRPAEELGYEREEVGGTAVWVQKVGTFTPTAGETKRLRWKVGDDEQQLETEVVDDDTAGNGVGNPPVQEAESHSGPELRCAPVEAHPSAYGAVIAFPADAEQCSIDPGDSGWHVRDLAPRLIEVLPPPDGGSGIVVAEYSCDGELYSEPLEIRTEGLPEPRPCCGPIETVSTARGALLLFPYDAYECGVQVDQAGWEVDPLTPRIFEVSVTPGEPGGQETVVATWTCGGEPFHEEIELTIEGTPAPTSRCAPVEAVATACGALVIFPCDATDTEVVAAGACTLEELRYNVNRLSDRVIEVVPGAPGTTGLDVHVRYSCGGYPYNQLARLSFGAGTHAAPDPLLQRVFSHPIRVAGGQLQAANGGAAGGVAIGAWTQQTIKAVFPALPQQFSPGQFAQQVQALAPPAGHPSPFGGTAVAAALAASSGGGALPAAGGGIPPSGGGGTPPSGGGGSGWYGPGTPMYPGGGLLPAPGGPGYGGATVPAAMASGQPPGPFADQVSIAAALELNALPALNAVMPVTNDADLDEVEAQRQVIRDALTTLVGELRRNSADGPDVVVVANAIARAQAALLLFGNALEIGIGRSVSNEDFANERRFQLLQTWILMAAGLPGGAAPGDPRAAIGRLKQLVQIVADSTRDLENVLDDFGLDANERGRVMVTPAPAPPLPAPQPPAPQNPMRLSRVLEWIADEAGAQMPSLLDTAGRQAAPSIIATFAQQIPYVTALTQLAVDPWTHPMVAGDVTELERQLNQALTEAQNL